jgi:Tfp pilus assembly protein PilX
MKQQSSRRGVALASVLVVMIVLFLLGVSIAGLQTSQARYSAWKYNASVTRQAAEVGIKKAEYILANKSLWDSASLNIGENTIGGSSYYSLEVNECGPKFCTVTSHAYFKDARGNHCNESKIKVTYRKNYFEYAALGACLGDTNPEPGVTVTGDSVVDGDVGSFKPANTVAMEIGNSDIGGIVAPGAAPEDPSPNPGPSVAPGPAIPGASAVTISALSAKPNPVTSTSISITGAAAKSVKARAALHTQSVQPHVQFMMVSPNQPNTVTAPTDPGGTSDPGTNTGSGPGGTGSADPAAGTNSAVTTTSAPAPPPDTSTITGNLYVYKNAQIYGNYKTSQLQIVGKDEVFISNYAAPTGRTYTEKSVPQGGTYTFSSGIYTFDKFTAESGSTINVDARRGPVRIYVKDSLSLNGSSFNVNGDPKNVIIYGLFDEKAGTSCSVNLSNGSQSSFLFQGKHSNITISNSKFEGSIIGNRVAIKNNSNVKFPNSLVKFKNKPLAIAWEET